MIFMDDGYIGWQFLEQFVITKHDESHAWDAPLNWRAVL